MMAKWIHKIVFIALISWGFYCIAIYAAEEVLLRSKKTQITLHVSSATNQTLIFSYNTLSSQIGTEVHTRQLTGNNEPQLINIPLPKDKIVKRIYVTGNTTPVEFDLSSVSLSQSYKAMQWPVDSLIRHMRSGNEGGAFQAMERTASGQIAVRLTKRFPVVEFTEGYTKQIYHCLHDRLRQNVKIIAFVFGLVLFFVFVFVQSRWTQPNYAINFATFFLCIIFTPFFSQKEHKSQENRTLAPFPNLNVNIWKIPGPYTTYYNDHFPYRNELSRLDNLLKIKLFNTSPRPDNVQIGKEDWLFCADHEVRAAYQNIERYTPEQLEGIGRKLERTARLLKQEGIDFYVMIPPMKHSIYPEYLPPTLRKRPGQNKREQVMAYLTEHASVQLIDPYPLLMQLKDTARIYYKNDTHWNQLGAFRVYQEMISVMAKNHPQLKPLELDQFEVSRRIGYDGDLLAMLNVENVFFGKPYKLTPKFTRKSGDAQNGQAIGTEQSYLYYEADSSSDLRLLVYRDSFGEYLRRHLAEHFSYTGFSWDFRINPERIKQAQPDIVVYEVVERFIDRLLEEEKQAQP
jgi:hypothetical protein